MRNESEILDFGGTSQEFDLEFDLRLNIFECFLIVPYALFVFPFVVIGEMMGRFYHRYNRKYSNVAKYRQSGFQSPNHLGPCCPWPRGSHV